MLFHSNVKPILLYGSKGYRCGAADPPCLLFQMSCPQFVTWAFSGKYEVPSLSGDNPGNVTGHWKALSETHRTFHCVYCHTVQFCPWLVNCFWCAKLVEFPLRFFLIWLSDFKNDPNNFIYPAQSLQQVVFQSDCYSCGSIAMSHLNSDQ